ncbi:unnamed protein product, partial [marine sediment metagenome]
TSICKSSRNSFDHNDLQLLFSVSYLGRGESGDEYSRG